MWVSSLGIGELHIRPAEIDDQDVVLQWMNKEEVWAMDSPEPFRESTDIESQWSDLIGLASAWMIDIEGAPIGHFGWVPHAKGLGEFYIVIGEQDHWGKGLGRGAMHWMLGTARRRKMSALYGRVLGHNVAALRFFNHCGFQPLAKTENYFRRNGELHDLHWIVHTLA